MNDTNSWYINDLTRDSIRTDVRHNKCNEASIVSAVNKTAVSLTTVNKTNRFLRRLRVGADLFLQCTQAS